MSEKRKIERRKRREPASNKLSLHTALLHKGYFDKDNNWNSLISLSKYPGKIFRNRVEVLIFNEKNQIFLCKEKNFYRVPGGSVEKDIPNHKQVMLEAKQEAKLNIENVKFSGIDYVRFFNKPFVVFNSSIYWDGVHNIIYTADYVSKYKGDVKVSLKDSHMLRYGKFYNIRDVYDFLKPEYKKIINKKFEQKRKYRSQEKKKPW